MDDSTDKLRVPRLSWQNAWDIEGRPPTMAEVVLKIYEEQKVMVSAFMQTFLILVATMFVAVLVCAARLVHWV